MNGAERIDEQWTKIFQLIDCIKYDDERQILGDMGDIAFKVKDNRPLLRKALLTWMLTANYMEYLGIFGAIMELYDILGFMDDTEVKVHE